MAELKLFLFGAPRVERDGQPLPLRRSKALALLAYLAVSRQPHTRATLTGLLWPEFDDASARNNLRRELSLLRSLLGEQALVSVGQQIGWNPQTPLWLDVAVFQARLDEARPLDALSAQRTTALEGAIALAGGEFMAGISLPDSPPFDEWQFFQREAQRQQVAEALDALVVWHGEQGALREAVGYARRRVALDPLHEPAQRALIRCYSLAGQQSAALRQYDECARLLDAELGVTPEAETRRLYEAVRGRRLLSPAHGATAGAADEPAPAQTKPALHAEAHAPHRPRPQLLSCIGRDEELAELRRLIVEEPECCLVTIVGQGGIGKTRLALAAAAALADLLPHGAAVVSLASLTRAELLPAAIAEALHLPTLGGADPREQLIAYLRDKRILLVLDNFEQLLLAGDGEGRAAGAPGDAGADGAAVLAELLRAAPGVIALVTSRERLNLQEEWCYELRGVRFPSGQGQAAGLSPAQVAAAYGAVQLFVERTRRADAAFTLSAEELPHVVRICQLLEGMPLGLELAASWVRVLSCRQIAEEIAGSLDFLSTSMRNLPERHRSLRAVFEQTWRRLTEAEQRTLCRLSVFSGGCTRHAAEAVAGATLAVLASLVNRALVRRSGGGRYLLHELVRQYAAERLGQTPGEVEVVQTSHARYYAALLHRCEAAIKGERQLEAVAEIAADLDNVRASWRWAVSQAHVELISQAQESLYHFYEMQGLAQEGAQAFLRAVAALRSAGQLEVEIGPAQYSLALGRLIGRQGFLANRLGQFAASLELMHEGVAFLRQGGPAARADLALALHFLGGETYFQGKQAEAERLLREGLALATELGDDWLIGLSWQGLGQKAEFQGEYADAVSCFEQSIVAYGRTGEQRWRAYALNNWGRAAYAMGAYAQAKGLLGEALEIRQTFGDLIGIGYSLLDLGKLAALQGRYAQAQDYMQQSLALCEEIGDRDQVARCQNGLGAVARLLGELEQAETHHRSSLATYDQLGIKRELPLTLNGLGQIAYDRGDVLAAERWFLESLKVSQELSHPGGEAAALCFLGHVAGALGRGAEASARYRQALAIVVRTGAAPVALDILLGWARLRAEEAAAGGSAERARRIVRLVAHHPAAPHELGERARALLRTLDPEGLNGLADEARGREDWRLVAEEQVRQTA